MKRLIMMIMAIMNITTSYAITICAKTGTYVGVLRKNVNGTVANVTNTLTKKQWAVTYNYKTITGYAACNEISGTTTPRKRIFIRMLVMQDNIVGVKCGRYMTMMTQQITITKQA